MQGGEDDDSPGNDKPSVLHVIPIWPGLIKSEQVFRIKYSVLDRVLNIAKTQK